MVEVGGKAAPASGEIDQGIPASKQSSMAKCFATDAAMKATVDAVQIFGGNGYTKEYPVEKLMRDAKLMQIYDGKSVPGPFPGTLRVDSMRPRRTRVGDRPLGSEVFRETDCGFANLLNPSQTTRNGL